MDLITILACVIVGFVIFLCWKTEVSNTSSALVFLLISKDNIYAITTVIT